LCSAAEYRIPPRVVFLVGRRWTVRTVPTNALRKVSAVLAAALVAGCARSHPVAGTKLSDVEVAIPPEPVVLEVENHNWSDINIYVLHDGRRDRLTMVTAAKDVSMEFPTKLQGEMGVFRLIVYRIGGRDSYITDPISIRTGNTVRLTVESDLQRTSVGVW
jgi:hypothetical protein